MFAVASAAAPSPRGQAQGQQLQNDAPERTVLGASESPARCPAQEPPLGLLYNHVSKTGGTSMRLLLNASCRSIVFPIENHHFAQGDEELGSENGACVYQDDIKRLAITSAELESYFVIATVRRPCDYYLSLWAYLSERPTQEWLWKWLWPT